MSRANGTGAHRTGELLSRMMRVQVLLFRIYVTIFDSDVCVSKFKFLVLTLHTSTP